MGYPEFLKTQLSDGTELDEATEAIADASDIRYNGAESVRDYIDGVVSRLIKDILEDTDDDISIGPHLQYIVMSPFEQEDGTCIEVDDIGALVCL